MSQLFNEKMMENKKNIHDWKECVKQGVDILVKNGYATEKLVDAIFESTERFGAYYVLEKGIALLHASPGDYSKKMGVSFMLLENNIQFNGEDKYARLIFTLSAPDAKSHIGVIQEFGNIFTNKEHKEKIMSCKSIEEIKKALEKIKK